MKLASEKIALYFLFYSFRLRLDTLEEAYRGAILNKMREKENIEKSWENFRVEVEAGRASYIEVEEESGFTYDYGEHVGEMLDEIDEINSIVREAFVISLHHLWEKQIKYIMDVSDYKQEDAFKYFKKKGIAIDQDGLDLLRLSANVAKHSSGSSAKQLFKKNPKFFDVVKMKSDNAKPSYEYLDLTSDIVDQLFVSVRKSIPSN